MEKWTTILRTLKSGNLQDHAFQSRLESISVRKPTPKERSVVRCGYDCEAKLCCLSPES